MNLATLEERDERSMDTFICEDEEESEDAKSEIENEGKSKEKRHFQRAINISDSITNRSMKKHENLRNDLKFTSGIDQNASSIHSEGMKYAMPKDKRFSHSISMPEDYNVSKKSEDSNTRIHPEKLTGYLEKRSKMLGWRRFWFVLDGRLLTYYKSKADYESLAAFSGSINIGIASAVRPIQIRGCKGFPLQIATRSQVYYLRSHDKKNLERWLIAIQESASSPNSNFDSDIFLRQESYSVLSQWSLNYSTEDLSQVYYPRYEQKYANFSTSQPIKKCFSLASLQQKSDGTSRGSQPLFARLVPHRQSNILFQKLNFDIESKHKSFEEESDESPPLLRKETEGRGRKKIRHSASMLVLNSSPAAGELRKELARKLSIGSAFPGLKPIDSDRHSNEFTLQKSGNSKARISTGEIPRKRDQIIRQMADHIEKGIYEPCGEPLSICTEESDIYENVDHFLPKNQTADQWDKTDKPIINVEVDEESNDIDSLRISINSRFSFRSIKEEIPEKFDNSTNVVETTNPIFRDEPQEFYFEKNEKKAKEESKMKMGRKNSADSVLSIDSGMIKEGKKKWKSSIGGFFQKIFKGSSEKGKKKEKNLIITSPMDFRRSQVGDEISPFSLPESSRNLTKVLKSSPANDVVIDELKGRMSVIKRNSLEFTLPNSDSRNEKSNWQIRRSNTFLGVSHQIIQESQADPQNNMNKLNAEEKRAVNKKIFEKNVFEETEKVIKNKESGKNQEDEANDQDEQITSKESFLMKLEKFNKLSEKFNAKDPRKREMLNCGRLGQVNPFIIKRSKSLSVHKVYLPVDEPPILPPKKRRSNSSSDYPSSVSIYDFPPNNTPVHSCNTPIVETVTYEDIIYADNPTKSSESLSKAATSLKEKPTTDYEPNVNPKLKNIAYQNTTEILNDTLGKLLEKGKGLGTDVPPSVPPPPPPPRPKRLQNKKQKEKNKKDKKLTNENWTKCDEVESGSQNESNESEETDESDRGEMKQLIDDAKRNSLTNIRIPVIETLGDETEIAETFEIVENIYDDVFECKFEPDIENMNEENDQQSIQETENVQKEVELTEHTSLSTENKVELIEQVQISGSNSVSSSETITQEDFEQNNEQELLSVNEDEEMAYQEGVIYENVKFANSEIIVQELETVSEIEDDETAELYDDFPYIEEKDLNEEGEMSYSKEEARAISVRHSGIDQLKAFLNFEVLDNEEKADLVEASSMRHGAISRLGHSSAVNQLKKIINLGSTNT